ncbi:MAG TPA: RagB/SusD family nutrient uptake outer membrane protein [Pedobacter sp.]|nr:RagB/SusD family nutrient uptake outer membrane protein [Pedobacter sp.]
MKKAIYTLSFFSILSFSACEKYLDVEPRASVSDKQTIYDNASAQTALTGVYAALAGGGYYGTTFQSIGYLNGDNIQWTGSQSQVQEFINHNVSADNSTISGAWSAIYLTISRANQVIEKVPQVTDPLLSQGTKDQIIGQAYFIRALAYFDLARTWGGAPLITKPTETATDNSEIPRSPQAEVYAQALSDLDKAEPLLTETTDRHRATRKTVWALKSRYYLYRGDWANAELYATRLITDNANYKLLKPFGSFFQNDARATQESVFELFYSAAETNGHRGQWQPQQNGGTRQWAPNDAFVALVNDPLKGGTRNVLVAKDNQNRWYGNLYYRSPATDPSYLIRIAELYLIRAEARANQAPDGATIVNEKVAGAIADLDAVRDRSGLTGTIAATKAEVLLDIENERRIEFAFEPHRWFDLVRTGRAAAVLNFTDTRKYLMPVPNEQLLIDPALRPNNPGY